MSQHKDQSDSKLIESLKRHHLPFDTPSQVADGFRNGWKARGIEDLLSHQIFRKEYDGESLYDLDRDIHECLNPDYNTLAAIPTTDEHGLHTGTFVVSIVWTPETDKQSPKTFPSDWSVFNSGACVADGLSYEEAKSYLTKERLEKGWCLVCVVNKDNFKE